MLQILCILIGRLLLIGIGVYDLLQLIWHRLHALACRSYDRWQCDQFEVLTRTRHELEKLPKHLVLVIAPDERYVDATLIKQIFSYAQLVGIPYISLYDTRTQLSGYVQLSRFCQSCDSADRSYLWPPTQVKVKEQKLPSNGRTANGSTNGYASKAAHNAQLQVYQIGAADGRALIADVCRELYEKRTTPEVQQLLEKRQRLTDGISSMLNKRLGMTVPEPELGIIFSRLTCTYGLLPWHVRFTEFHTHHSGRYFNAKSFAELLYKYARCEQRWGK